MILEIPPAALVLLVGPAGSGKSTFARKHFKPTEILSSDYMRAMISDDETNQEISRDAFEVLHLIAKKRLTLGRLTVVDATNVQGQGRRPLLSLAEDSGREAVAVVFDIGLEECLRRNRLRLDRNVEEPVIEKQAKELRESRARLGDEGFSRIYSFVEPEEMNQATIRRL